MERIGRGKRSFEAKEIILNYPERKEFQLENMRFSIGQQIEMVIDEIRRDIQKDCISVEYLYGIFGRPVAMAAISYLQARKEIDGIKRDEIGMYDALSGFDD